MLSWLRGSSQVAQFTAPAGRLSAVITVLFLAVECHYQR